MKSTAVLGSLVGTAVAQSTVAAWGQCGGIGYTGSTTCASGSACVYNNDYYSQCIPGAAASTTLKTSSTSTAKASSTKSSSSSQPTGGAADEWWIGVNESGAEFGTALPGVWGTDYIFPDTSTIATLISEGFTIFRIPFAMERMTTSSLTGSLNADYLKNLTTVAEYITSHGAHAILDPHNYGRYFGNIITSTSDFQTWWTHVATQFKDNSNIIFDTNNEYHGMDQTLVLNLNQAAINGIRAAGATSQYIFVEGNYWTGAWDWTTYNDNMKGLTDPQNKIIYEMHQYLDSDDSGTSTACVSTTIGQERVVDATNWLRDNGKLGIIGEFAGGANSDCLTAVEGLLSYLKENDDVWLGALFWAAGPWWGNYYYSFEPPSGVDYVYYESTLKKYM